MSNRARRRRTPEGSRSGQPTRNLIIQRIKHRRTIQGRVDDFPEFTHIGYDLFSRVGKLGGHAHPGMFEFCLIVRGHVTWWAKDKTYELRGGDVYFTWPDEPHGGLHNVMHPCTIYWTTLRVPKPASPAARRFLHLPPAESQALCAAIHALPDRHLRGAERLEPYCEALFTHLETGGRLGVIQARASLQGFLATLVTLPHAGTLSEFVPPGIARARNFLDDCPRPWPKVAELADIAGMSASHFHACFAREVGMAPMEYAHRERLERAQALLKEPRATVTSVATQLGYCSSQHLAACFRQYLGRSPTGSKSQPA